MDERSGGELALILEALDRIQGIEEKIKGVIHSEFESFTKIIDRDRRFQEERWNRQVGFNHELKRRVRRLERCHEIADEWDAVDYDLTEGVGRIADSD